MRPPPSPIIRFAAVAAVLVCAFAIVAPHQAHAFGLPDPKEIGLKIVDAILNTIEKGTSFLMQTAAQFLTFVLVDVNGSVGFYSNTFVRIGWSVVRDVANLAFLPFLLIAAFGTLFRIDAYGFRRVIPRLVLVALLVNFSLVITGLVVNVSQVMTEYFVVNVAQQSGYSDIGNALAQGFHLGAIGEDQQTANIRAFESGGTAEVEQSIITDFMAIIFDVIAMMIFFLLAIAFVVRIIMLWVLMILSPLAFVAAIIPATQSAFNEWMKKFVHWATFGIVASFFVWLATVLVFALNGDFTTQLGGTSLSASTGGLALLSSGDKLLGYIALSVFLLMALAMAKEGAGKLGNVAVATMGGAVTGAVGFGMGTAGTPALRAIRARAGRGIKESRRAQGVAGFARRVVTPLRQAPIIGGAFGGIHEGLRGFEAGIPMKRDVDSEIARYKKMGFGAAALADVVPKIQAQKLALSKMLADQQAHLLPDETIRNKVAAHHNEAMNVAVSSGNKAAAETILRTNFTQFWDQRPTTAQRLFPGKTRNQAIHEYVGANSSEEDLRNPDIAHRMDQRNIQAVNRSGRRNQQIAVAQGLLGEPDSGVVRDLVGVNRQLLTFLPGAVLAIVGATEYIKKQGKQIDRLGQMGVPGETALQSRGVSEEAGTRAGEGPSLAEAEIGKVGEGQGPSLERESP